MTLLKTPPYHLERNGQRIDLSGSVYFDEQSKFGRIEVHTTWNYGYVMFIDGEAQISSRDYKLYHESMLAFVRPSSSILVIGDGDGGFTGRADYRITHVEHDPVIRAAAEQYFDAEWRDDRLYDCSLNDYLRKHDKGSQYDAIFLAITDEFNADGANFADVKALWDSKLRPGGVMVSQVGCLLDPNYPFYEANHNRFVLGLGDSMSHTSHSTPYIPVFHSQHHFLAVHKR